MFMSIRVFVDTDKKDKRKYILLSSYYLTCILYLIFNILIDQEYWKKMIIL